jgi:hypothetical protein
MLIGFNGTMGVGKSTAVNLLSATAGSPVVLVKFAQPLYDMQEVVYDRIRSVYRRPSTFVKDRKLLQWLGTDWGRDTISKTLWVDLWKARVKAVQQEFSKAIVVCDDVRFDNEGEALTELGGLVVRITSDRAGDRIDTKAGIANHASEAGIAEKYLFRTIANNGTIDEFKESLSKLYQELGVGQSEAVA